MADCIQVVNGKQVRAPLRYKAPRRAIVTRPVPPKPEPLPPVIKKPDVPMADGSINLARIIGAAVKATGYSAIDIKSPRRFKSVCHVRQAVMYLACKLTPLSLPTIGGILGGRDHSTVLHGRDKVARNYELFRPLIEAILAEDAVLSKAVDGLGISQDTVSPYADERGMVAT